jgi:hypothetical protein
MELMLTPNNSSRMTFRLVDMNMKVSSSYIMKRIQQGLGALLERGQIIIIST